MSEYKFQIISDGACDLMPEYVSEHEISVVPFYVTFDGENYTKEGEGIDHNIFYKKMIDEHAVPKSSLPSIQDFVDKMMPYIENNMPIVCITITAKFSGSFNAANLAKEQILEDYPNAKIEVIDSTLNTASQAVFVNEAVRLRDGGIEFEDAVKELNTIKTTGRIYFTVGSMEYLVKNGRAGKLLVLAGDKLGIRPVITMEGGDISLGGVARSRKKSLSKVLANITEYFNRPENNKEDYNFIVACGYGIEEANEFQKQFEEALGIKCYETVPCRIGTAIGCHTGPYALGIGFVKKTKLV